MRNRFTLKKHQILRSGKEINYLFEKGKFIAEYPVKVVYTSVSLKNDEGVYTPFKVMFIAPKKLIKKATARNRIKRKLKESFRLLQHNLFVPENQILHLAFIYISKKTDDNTQSKIHSSVEKLINTINSTTNNHLQ